MSLIVVSTVPRIVFHIVIVLFLVSCSSGSEAEKKEVLEAVKHYNGMMRRAYMEANLDLLSSVATEQQMSKLFPVINAMQTEESFMMADQETFIVKKVSAGRSTSYVETEERWTYWWQNARTMEITRPQKTITYELHYNLVRENGILKVDSIESTD